MLSYNNYILHLSIHLTSNILKVIYHPKFHIDKKTLNNKCLHIKQGFNCKRLKSAFSNWIGISGGLTRAQPSNHRAIKDQQSGYRQHLEDRSDRFLELITVLVIFLTGFDFCFIVTKASCRLGYRCDRRSDLDRVVILGCFLASARGGNPVTMWFFIRRRSFKYLYICLHITQDNG